MTSRSWIHLTALVLLTAAWYWPSTDYDFVGVDDPTWVTENPHVRFGLGAEQIQWAFTTSHAANWLPLTWISLMLDAPADGHLDPARFHRTNVLLHALGTGLLFLALLRLTGDRWTSLLVAALFALHPLRVESVVWITERKDVLSGVFWFGCMLAWAEWARSGRRAWYAATAILLGLGLMAKAMLVTLPAVLLLLDVWPLRRPLPWSRRVREKLPLFALAIAMAAVTFVVQRNAGAVSDIARIDMGDRLATAVVAYARYVQLSAWPDQLSYFYIHPVIRDGSSWSPWLVLGCALCLLAVTAGAIVLNRRGFRPPLIGWLWYLGTLVPVIGLVQVGNQWSADRYTYIPQVGIWIALAWSVKKIVARRARAAATAVVLVALTGFAVQTRRVMPAWRDSTTLFERALEVDSRNYYALTGLGVARASAGDVAAAIPLLQRAVEIRPLARAHVNLGSAYMAQRNWEAAAAQFEAALSIEPDALLAHLNLANCALATNRLDLARHHFEVATRLAPGEWRAWAGLGRVHGARGEWTEAVRALEQAHRIWPRDERVKRELDDARARAARD